MLPAAARADDNLAAYLRARAADAEGSERAAAAGYATALAADPANAELAIRAYRAGLAAGDMALARRARGVLESAGVVPADAALIALGDALNGGDAAKINDAVKAIAAGPFSFLAPSIRAWLAPLNDAGAVNAALDGARGSALASRFADHTRLLTDIAGGRVATGMTMARLMTVSDPGAISLRVAAAQMLAGAGQREAALSLLPADTATLAPYRAALGSGTPATARIGIAWLYIQLAESLGDKRVAPAAVALSRAAETLDPGNDRARLALARALVAGGVPKAALAALDHIPPASPATAEAAAIRIEALQAAKRDVDALHIAAALNDAPGADRSDAQLYGDLLVAADRYDEAARAYATALARAGSDADWTLHLQLGGALERAGQWPEARRELQMAVRLAPQSAIALNYLGYAELDHGGSPAEAAKLLEQANRLKPDTPSIIDSLAWAYFRGGDVAKALPLLEKAAAGEPDNATINEHLGDVYWSVGRFYEARYAWRAATVTAPTEDQARLAAKLDAGPAAPQRTALR